MGAKVKDYPNAREVVDGVLLEFIHIGRVDPPLYLESPKLPYNHAEVVAWHNGGPLPVAWSSWVSGLPPEDQARFLFDLPRLR